MQKLCNNCLEAAEVSIVTVISSVGVSRRIQETSAAVLFCGPCLREMVGRSGPNPFENRVNTALTRVEERLRQRSESSNGRAGDSGPLRKRKI